MFQKILRFYIKLLALVYELSAYLVGFLVYGVLNFCLFFVIGAIVGIICLGILDAVMSLFIK